jgi:foldase protein PrsA
MSKVIRCGFAVGLAVIAGVGLAACGGGLPGDAVAQVGGGVISKATLAHWTSVEFVTDHEQNAQQPVPSGLIPDPPLYTACIARLRTIAPKATKGRSAPTNAQLKRECEQSYQAVQRHVLNVLIVFEWKIEEGARQGLKLTDAEVKREYSRFSHERFKREGELQKFLAHTGESFSDELLRMKIDLLGVKLDEQEIAKLGGVKTERQQRAFIRWGNEYVKTSVAKTSCRVGYIVENCKQYKGALPPDPRI